MSTLAFDKHGKPFAFHRLTTQLLVRVFKSPSARGTCSRVLDTNGEPLIVDADLSVAEFRQRVGYVPGLYRLDQCDEEGNEIDDAPPAYVSIDAPRNAAYGDVVGEPSALVVIQQMAQQMVTVQADAMKTLVMQHATMMAAAAEMMRAPYRPAPSALPAPELRNADVQEPDDDRDDDEDDEYEEAPAPEHPATAALRMLQPHLPLLGGFLWEKCAEFLSSLHGKKATTPPAATPGPIPTPAPTVAPTTSQPSGDGTDVAAGSSAPPPPPPPPVVPATAPPPVGPVAAPPPAVSVLVDEIGDDDVRDEAHSENGPSENVPTTIVTITAPASDALASPTSVAPPIPTRKQFEHLTAIRTLLSPTERAIAQNTIARMDPRMLADWLLALSAMSVDEAAALIRRMVAEIHPPAAQRRTDR